MVRDCDGGPGPGSDSSRSFFYAYLNSRLPADTLGDPLVPLSTIVKESICAVDQIWGLLGDCQDVNKEYLAWRVHGRREGKHVPAKRDGAPTLRDSARRPIG